MVEGNRGRRRARVLVYGALVTAALLSTFCVALAQLPDPGDDEAIKYSTTPAHDAITRLQEAIDHGKAALPYEPDHGYLRAVLHALKIPSSSQLLVFSKTSFQREIISPSSPRALYFNDNTYIGWVQGGPVLEIATVDPQLGTVFYLLPQTPSAMPQFIRQNDECLQCHTGSLTQGVPGLTMRSVFPDATGQPLLQAGTFVTTDASPLSERWGGWYVTGHHGAQRHMGNVFAHSSEPDKLDREQGANVTDLRSFVDTSPYLAGSSDIVALMVAEHQTHVSNLITRANYETRIALNYERALNKDLGRPLDFRSESTISRIKSAAEPLVQALLFSGEAPLTAPVSGTSGFDTAFAAAGPFDSQRRSLRQLDLRHRLFKYPCSYLVYSDAFDGLPPLAKEYVYRRFVEILTGHDHSAPFANLSDADRKEILEILEATKPDFAAFHANHRVAETRS